MAQVQAVLNHVFTVAMNLFCCTERVFEEYNNNNADSPHCYIEAERFDRGVK